MKSAQKINFCGKKNFRRRRLAHDLQHDVLASCALQVSRYCCQWQCSSSWSQRTYQSHLTVSRSSVRLCSTCQNATCENNINHAKSVQQFRRRCIPDRQTDRQTGSRLNIRHYNNSIFNIDSVLLAQNDNSDDITWLSTQNRADGESAGHESHGSHGSLVKRVMSYIGHVPHGLWVVGHMGHESHGSRGLWVKRVMSYIGYGSNGSWVKRVMAQTGHMGHESGLVTRWPISPTHCKCAFLCRWAIKHVVNRDIVRDYRWSVRSAWGEWNQTTINKRSK